MPITSDYDSKCTPWQIEARAFPGKEAGLARNRFLLRYAVLAPSSHNTQPWLFRVDDDSVHCYADLDRWLRIADADRRELYISLGCALENLLIAAEHFGIRHTIKLTPSGADPTLAAVVHLAANGEATPYRAARLFAAIPQRHTNHKPFDGRPISAANRDFLAACQGTSEPALALIDDPDAKRAVEDLIVRGDAIQFSDPAWRAELGQWLGRGVFGQSWPMAKIAQLAVTHLNMGKRISKTDSALLTSAPILGVITAPDNDPVTWLRTGQLFQRVSLAATSTNLAIHPMSQALEIPELKAELASALPIPTAVPQHLFRLGYAKPEKAHTPRRPLEEVLLP